VEADGGGPAQLVAYIAIIAVPLLAAIILHEVAHGVVAYALGDPTAARHGRLTLNPIPHIDPIGTILLPALLLIAPHFLGTPPFVFGWAKPVPIDPRRMRNPRRDSVLVALAGPATNLLLALLSVGVLVVLPESSETGSLVGGLGRMALASVWINCVLAVFNLIPVPPLDGGRLVTALLPPSASRAMRTVEGIGFVIVVLIVMNTNIVGTLVRPVVGFFFRLAGLAP
jgi:Zn-dependent protease